MCPCFPTAMAEHSEHARHSAALRARAPCESTPWRPGCHRPPAGAQWGKEMPCLLPMQDTAGRTPSLLAFTLEQCPSWPRRRVALSPDVTTWGVRSNPHHPWAVEGRPIRIRRPGYTRLGLQGSERGSTPSPSSRRGPAALPRRTPASPQALLARASSRSCFDLAGKISVGSSCLANWMHFILLLDAFSGCFCTHG